MPIDFQRHQPGKGLKKSRIMCPLDIHVSFSSLGEKKKPLNRIPEIYSFPNEQL